PRSAFDAVFGTAPPPPASDGEPAEADPLAERRLRSLALLEGEVASLRDRVGVREANKLGLHAESLAAIRARIMGTSGGAGGGGGGGGCAPGSAPTDTDSDLTNSRLQLDLAVAAFACDTTRVASVQFGHHQNTQVALPGIGTPGNWHNDFMHSDPAPRRRLIEVERWLCQQFVDAGQRLKGLPAPDGNGTLWDQTLMIWTRDMGDGISHAGDNMRFVISGGAGGYLRTAPGGRYINGSGAPHLRVLLTAAEAMGIEDFSGFGDRNLSGSDRQAVEGARA
ncbi:MAG: DUF1552 domain-containing protein, partial [Myxococcota bacterium]